jgi:macrolide-specific efflux system membrane fusion protein
MKKFFFLLLLGGLCGGGYYYYRTHQKKVAAAAAPVTETARVERRTLRRTVESTGEIRPDNRLEVRSPIAGRLEELLVDEGDLIEKGQVVAWVSSTERATLLDTARAKGPEELSYWETIYKAAPLVSPLGGTVIVRSLEPGQTISSSSAVIVIADRLIIVGQVDETDIGTVFAGQTVEVRLDAYPQSRFSGTVKRIAYDSKIVSNVTMYEVELTAENLPEFARSGMTATLTFLIEEHPDVLTVPTSALEYREEKAFVRLATPAGSAPELRQVQTGLSQDAFTEIVSGLEPSDTVLIPQVARKKETASNPFLPSRPASGGARPQGGSPR